MKPADVTAEWLQSLSFKVQPVGQATIDGVLHRRLNPIVDGRGEVTELWSQPWDGFTEPTHIYQSCTDHGVIKCWHLHEIHVDQFAITRGKVQVTLVDLREDSATFAQANVFVLGTLNPGLLRIPQGLLHGWKALSGPEVLVLNFQSHLYDPADEYKFPWNCILEGIWQPRNG